MNLHRRYVLFLLLLIPPFLFRDYSPNNELVYIATADEALQNHTWFAFYNHGAIYADKPPLYFWLLMGIKALCGSYPMWMIGVLSILPAVGVLMIMDKWLRPLMPDDSAQTANFLLLTTGFFLGSSLVVRMDMLMTFFIVLSLYTFYRVYTRRSRPYERWILPVYIFLALFAKGPVGVMVPLVSMALFLTWKKELKTMGRYFGPAQWGILLGLCALWFVAVYREGGSEYLHNILFKQTIGRGINSFHHKEPVYYYLLHLPLTFLPWTLLYLSVLLSRVRRGRSLTDVERLFVVVILSTLVLLSIVSAKLDIYLLPVYPFVAYLAVLRLEEVKDRWYVKASVALPALVFALAFPASFVVLPMLPYSYEDLTAGYAALLLLSGGGVVSLLCLWKRQVAKSIIASACGVLLFLFVASCCLPQFNEYIGWKELAAKGEEQGRGRGSGAYAFYKFRSGENMDFYLHKPLRRIDTVEELEQMESGPRTIVFVEDWYVEREPRLRQWLSCQAEVFPVGAFKVVAVGGK